MAIHVVKEPVPKPGTLGRTELYALAIGQVIGAGVILSLIHISEPTRLVR